MTHSPVPGLATRLLTWRLPAELREPFLGDLAERFQEIRAVSGAAAARRWYWSETLSALLLRWDRPPASSLVANADRGAPMDAFRSDLRAGLRTLRQAPQFALLVIITFALGIGTASAIFSVVNPVLLQSPPYPDAGRLTLIFERDKDGEESHTGFATYVDLAQSRTLASSAAMSYWLPILEGDEPEVLTGQRVSSSFFRTVGITPALGRDFTPEEDHVGAPRVVILSHDLWQRRFGGDPSIVGRTFRFGGNPYEVIGVMPATFESLLAPAAQVWSPLRYELTDNWACRGCRHLRMVARLKEGVTLAQADADLQRLSQQIVAAHPSDYSRAGVSLLPLKEYLTRRSRPLFLVVAGAVLLLLLLACTNGANLLLGRAIDRGEEFAVRAALGAGRWTLVRQVIAESLVLALLAGALGVAVALGGVRLLVQLAPSGVPRLGQIRVDGTVLLFTVLLSVLVGVVASLAPAMALGRASLAALVRGGGRSIVRGEGSRVRRTLVTAGVALALMLLVGAGLLMRSVDRLLAVAPGFDPRQLLTMELQATADSDAAIRRYYRELQAELAQLPGVQQVSLVNQLPLSGDFDMWGVRFESRPVANPADAPSAFRYAMAPGYLATMGIPLLDGRDFTPADDETHPPVALISQRFARRVLGEENPIGQRVKMGDPRGPWVTIVGVVGDIHHQGLDTDDEAQVYVPASQTTWAYNRMFLVIRSSVSPVSLVPSVRQAIHRLDPGVPVSRVLTMRELVRSTIASRRLALILFELFAVVAVVLAAAGLYGVIAASVSQRTREIGIRSALGATAGRILGLILGQGMRLALGGLALGLAGALILSRLLGSLLYGISPTDPGTLAAVGLVLTGVALLACWVPARRALRIDPVKAMRQE